MLWEEIRNRRGKTHKVKERICSTEDENDGEESESKMGDGGKRKPEERQRAEAANEEARGRRTRPGSAAPPREPRAPRRRPRRQLIRSSAAAGGSQSWREAATGASAGRGAPSPPGGSPAGCRWCVLGLEGGLGTGHARRAHLPKRERV